MFTIVMYYESALILISRMLHAKLSYESKEVTLVSSFTVGSMSFVSSTHHIMKLPLPASPFDPCI